MSQELEVVLVDVGNTHIKSAEVVKGDIMNERHWKNLPDLERSYLSSIPFCVCNTGAKTLSFGDRAVHHVSNKSSLPIHLNYKTTETLGADRIAAAVGCMELFPKQNSLLIDLGTCMTLDFISKDGVFEGGVISPGLKMRMKSMARSTANLPDISEEWEDFDKNLIGKSTKECLNSGSYFGIINEINGVIGGLRAEFTSLNVILTGGDAIHFESKVKAHIFAGSKIVLTGLYRIWKNQ